MNATTRAILQTVLASDASVAEDERAMLDALVTGKRLPVTAQPQQATGPLLVTQKEAARMLSVSSRDAVAADAAGNFSSPRKSCPGRCGTSSKK